MTERAQREMAWLLVEGSDFFDFDTALELVQRRPAEAEKILQMRQESRRTRDEFARLRERRRQVLREGFL